ncbi:MAG: DUF2085 domain-containing protein [Candidatus Thermoplasmatota archaeon]|nr:DUF2085 domain-containing protein [Candidatus Thermoplasmatota archaeon]
MVLRTWTRFICHQRPERALRIGSWRSPLCARCTTLYLGLVVGFVVGIPYSFPFVLGFSGFFLLILAFAPVAIDGITQAVGWRESTTWLRLVTGAVAGIALGMIYEGVILG